MAWLPPPTNLIVHICELLLKEKDEVASDPGYKKTKSTDKTTDHTVGNNPDSNTTHDPETEEEANSKQQNSPKEKETITDLFCTCG